MYRCLEASPPTLCFLKISILFTGQSQKTTIETTQGNQPQPDTHQTPTTEATQDPCHWNLTEQQKKQNPQHHKHLNPAGKKTEQKKADQRRRERCSRRLQKNQESGPKPFQHLIPSISSFLAKKSAKELKSLEQNSTLT